MASATTTKKSTAKKSAKASATKSSARSETGERLRKAAQAEIAERLERLEKDEATGDTASGTTKGAGTDSATTSAATDTAPAKPKAKAAKPAKSKRVSALDAAAIVVRTSTSPMRPSEMVDAMKAQGLWSSPTGKTPGATLYAAIIREIARKGDASRFRKAERGRFTANARKSA